MSNAGELMIDIYNTLMQVRYPNVTTIAAKNVQEAILRGENRLSLLSWLACEKSPSLAMKMPKLKGATLEAELFKYYSEIGICTDKKLLLGDCPLEEQLPMLRLLLSFIRYVFIEVNDNELGGKQSLEHLLNIYINDDPYLPTSNIQPKLTPVESIAYFKNLEKHLNEFDELPLKCDCEKTDFMEENLSEVEKKSEEDEIERDSMFNAERKNFLEAFSSIGSWPVFTAKNVKHNSYSMDADIMDIYTNFTALTQFLQAKEEILNANVPAEINKLHTPLTEIVDEAVTQTEEARRAIVDNC